MIFLQKKGLIKLKRKNQKETSNDEILRHGKEKWCHFSAEMTTFLPEMKISEKYASGPQLERTIDRS